MYVEVAKIEDVISIAIIHRACWADTYQFIPKILHEQRSLDFRIQQWKKAILTDIIGERVFILKTHQHKPVGFTYCRPNTDQDIDVVSELHATYVLKDYRGGISGPILKRAAMRYLDSLNKTPVGFWAFDQNKAVIIHRSWGWKGVVRRDRIIHGIAIPETGFIHPDHKHLLDRLDNFIDLRAKRRKAV